MNAPTQGYTLGFIQSMLTNNSGIASGWFKGMELKTAFQPVFSLPHKRAIGFDASLRGTDSQGKPVAAESLFGPVENFSETSLLDFLCTTMHVHNFFSSGQTHGLLFVNLHPEVFLDSEHTADFVAALIKHFQVPEGRLVIDIPGSVLQDKRLGAPLDQYRQLGCLISIDDFGVENTDLDTIWKSAPTLVKMGHAVIADATVDERAQQALPQVVSLLHEMGTLVLMEGVETETQARTAIDADADFAAGFYFGNSYEELTAYAEPASKLENVWNQYQSRRPAATTGDGTNRALFESTDRALLEEESLHSSKIRKLRNASPAEISQHREERRPFITAIQHVASRVKSGDYFDTACSEFLVLPDAIRCYMLDASGRQINIDVAAPKAPTAQGVNFDALAAPAEANWSRREFFRRALKGPEIAQVTRQYCSLSGYTHCVTFSVATTVRGKPVVVCGDVDWSSHAGVRP